MKFLKLCGEEPLLSTLKDTFNANPIRVPEERIIPLTVISKEDNKCKYIGEVSNLLKDKSSLSIEIKNSTMANLSAKRTKTVKTDLGLKVMDGFLKGLGSNAASIKFAFDGTTEVSFSFENVKRKYVDLALLADILSKKKFDETNPINKRFINEEAQCIIVDSVITSNNFSIRVENSENKNFSFDVPKLEKILSANNNNIKIASTSKVEISFNGTKHLAFAFTGMLLEIDDGGNISYEGESDRAFLTKVPTETSEKHIPPHFLLSEEFGLNEIE